MALLKTIQCDIQGCKTSCTEPKPGDGWVGWGQLQGIILNGNENPYLCPEHLGRVADFADSLGVK